MSCIRPRAMILRADGTNCDKETMFGLEQAGAEVDIVHIESWRKHRDPIMDKEISLSNYQIFVLAGGFSDGDYISAGQTIAYALKTEFKDEIEEFIAAQKLAIGICNGFQIMVKSGLLPTGKIGEQQSVTLTHNQQERFEAYSVSLRKPANGVDKCVWTAGIHNPDFYIAHGEGRFYTDQETKQQLYDNGQVVFQYADEEGNPSNQQPYSPNGSTIAAICDRTGRILGMMPHPERSLSGRNNHLNTLQDILRRDYVDSSAPEVKARLNLINQKETPWVGLQLLKNGVEHARQHLM